MLNLDKLRTREDPEAVNRYMLLKKLGKKIFADSHVVKTGEVNGEDILNAGRFLAEAITSTNPPVWASWFEHVFIAQELGRRIGDATTEFLLLLHENGRLVTNAYLRNDYINRRLLKEFGIPTNIIDEFFPVERFIRLAGELELSDEQLAWKEGFSEDQKEKALAFFESLTNRQRITNLADNLGKRKDKGLFDIQGFFQYLQTQEQRYKGESPWTSENWSIPRRPGSAVLQAFIVEKTLEWLQEKGVDIETALRELDDYGPKFVIVARHGELYNPNNILYNRDRVMKAEDIIHLSDYGKEQMRILGQLISKRKFRVSSIDHSPSTRAVESKDELNKALGVEADKMHELDDLDDVYAPGGYLIGMKLDEFVKQGGNAYEPILWAKYNHEGIPSVAKRLERVFWQMAKSLKVGETGVIVSHGDPIAIWIQNLITGQVPLAENLRKGVYPNKGEAIVAIIDPQGNFFTHYILTDPSLKEGKMY